MIGETLTLAVLGISPKLAAEIGMVVGTLMGGISIGYIVKRIKVWLAKKRAQETSELPHDVQSLKLLGPASTHSSVNEALTELRSVLNAERAQVGQFHNGGHFLDGSPVKRFSVSHESVDEDAPHMAFQMQNVLLSLFWDVVPLLQENVAVGRVASELPDCYFKSVLLCNKIHAFALLPLRKWHAKTRKSQIIGYVMVEWDEQKSYEAQSESHIRTQLRNARTVIEGQIVNSSG